MHQMAFKNKIVEKMEPMGNKLNKFELQTSQ
jgi:hypothetical protein